MELRCEPDRPASRLPPCDGGGGAGGGGCGSAFALVALKDATSASSAATGTTRRHARQARVSTRGTREVLLRTPPLQRSLSAPPPRVAVVQRPVQRVQRRLNRGAVVLQHKVLRFV